ncbi:MAG: pantetheine-phosphate adenylyltransferase [Oscillospiraceae bacterium]|nr:pantetheine-phosphate adenylyltransferase [Oscillospiraceae bacterium]
MTAIYPGSFDPITLGHLNIIRRASKIFDRLYVCVLVNSDKNTLFTRNERVELITRCVSRFGNVVVEMSDDLGVSYAREKNASVIIKGLRAVSDFDREFQIALANKKIDDGIETLFMAAGEKYTYLSSTVVKEMANYGADITEFVPVEILEDVLAKVRQNKAGQNA